MIVFVHTIADYTMDNDSQKATTVSSSYPVIAIVAALALFGVVVITMVTIPLQEAEASCITGFFHSGNQSAVGTAFENSKGRCFFHP